MKMNGPAPRVTIKHTQNAIQARLKLIVIFMLCRGIVYPPPPANEAAYSEMAPARSRNSCRFAMADIATR